MSKVRGFFRRLIRKLPPFRGIYLELGRLREENAQKKAREEQLRKELREEYRRQLDEVRKDTSRQLADLEQSFQHQMERMKEEEDSRWKEFEKSRSQREEEQDETIRKCRKLMELQKKYIEQEDAQQKDVAAQCRKLSSRIDWVVAKEKELAESLRMEQKAQKETAESLQKKEKVQKETAESIRKEVKALGEREKKERRELRKDLKKDLTGDMEYYYYKLLPEERYEEELKEWYYNKTGEVLHLDHPVTYNEKIQWMKLYDSTSKKTLLADKYRVRDWVAEQIGQQYLIPLLGVYDHFDEIDLDALPDRFVIKTNHAYKTNWIVTDKSAFDRKAAKLFFDKAMQRDFAYRSGLQLHYKGIERKLIVEEYLENSTENLDDYKVYCFGGKAECIEYMTGRNQELRAAFYDTEWNLLPIRRMAEPCEQTIERPQNLEKLIELAEILGRGFAHVRVDFYLPNDGSIRFGEMTFTPANGIRKWDPPEYNRIYGDLIRLPGEMQSHACCKANYQCIRAVTENR